MSQVRWLGGDDEASSEPNPIDTEFEVICPYCGEPVTIALDPGGGPAQDYVEDCAVCCQPWQLHVRFDVDGAAHAWAEQA